MGSNFSGVKSLPSQTDGSLDKSQLEGSIPNPCSGPCGDGQYRLLDLMLRAVWGLSSHSQS